MTTKPSTAATEATGAGAGAGVSGSEVTGAGAGAGVSATEATGAGAGAAVVGPGAAVTVVGLGPAGRIVAHRAAALGAQVRAFDPTGGQLPSTIGVWAHQLPAWAPGNLVRSRCQPHILLHDGTRRTLTSTYCVLDNSVLETFGGFETIAEKYEISGEGLRAHERGQSANPRGRYAEVASEGLIYWAAGGTTSRIRQLAIGHIFAEDDLPMGVREPVLMDFTAPHGHGAGSFSYRVPLGNHQWLIEETILATQLGADREFSTAKEALAWLRQRQSQRLVDLGVEESRALEEELVNFTLVPDCPPRLLRVNLHRRPIPFGHAGGWMHPATGYSVGAVLAGVDAFLRTGAHTPPGGALLWRLRRQGLAALLSFSAEQQAQFFTAFFQLPERRIFAYLTGTSVVATLGAMVGVAKPLAKTNLKVLVQLVRGFLHWG